MAATAINAENNVKKIYLTVIDEVLSNVREVFLDEGYDEQLLQELKNMWEAKLNSARALQSAQDDPSNGSSNNGNTSNKLPTTLTRETPVNIKQEMDSATRSALNALPQAYHPSASTSHQNGKKLHTPQLDGTVETPEVNTKSKKTKKKPQKVHITFQVDGVAGADDSDIDDDEDDDIGEVSIHGDEDDDDIDDEKANENSEYEGKEDPDPLNSDDDLTEPGTPDSNADLFDTDNVIVCQYDKITRIKNRWKFHLKDGVMNINNRDYLFSKANGDAEW